MLLAAQEASPVSSRDAEEVLAEPAKVQRESPMGTASNRILILFAHPALERSRVNRVLVRGLDRMEGVTFHDLYEAYPDFDVDVEREQTLLGLHDVVIMHHPFFWYSTPALLKQWEDLVLVHGWAYGTGGTALHGKKLMSAITTGGSEAAYRSDGHNAHTIDELLLPIKRTAILCGMEYLRPFVVYGAHGMTKEQMNEHAATYRERLNALRGG